MSQLLRSQRAGLRARWRAMSSAPPRAYRFLEPTPSTRKPPVRATIVRGQDPQSRIVAPYWIFRQLAVSQKSSFFPLDAESNKTRKLSTSRAIAALDVNHGRPIPGRYGWSVRAWPAGRAEDRRCFAGSRFGLRFWLTPRRSGAKCGTESLKTGSLGIHARARNWSFAHRREQGCVERKLQ